MKLSLVFELLLIFVLLAFAASEAKSVGKQKTKNNSLQTRNDAQVGTDNNDDKPEESSINKYCRCTEAHCNCCREFSLPYVNLDGPGCASLMYLESGKMSVSLSFGKKVITNKTLRSNKPSPVCMPLPGGITKFCGRVYNIARTGEEFRACLGLELQNKKTVEAAVRVSCFKFGPRGVHSEPADPLPLVPQDEKVDEEDDDDDDDDDYGLGDDDDSDLAGINDVDSADYTGFSLLSEDLLGDLFGGSSSGTKKSNKNRKKQAPAVSTTTTTKRPRTTRPRTTRRPISRTPVTSTARTTTVRVRPGTRRTRRPTRKPGRPTRRPTTSSIDITSAENSIGSSLSTTISTTAIPPSSNPSTESLPVTQRIQYMSTAHEETYEPILLVTQRPFATVSASTHKPTTNFADPGIEMSLAQLTGQLSAMPTSPIVQEGAKDTGMLTTSQELVNFEKVETITPKSTTAAFASTSNKVNDDMVQIVHSLDSEEQSSEKEKTIADESRSHQFTVPAGHYEGLSLPKHKNRQFSMEDLDVLDLTSIGESVGEQIGLFGRDKRQNKDHDEQQSNNKVKDTVEKDEEDDDDDTSDYDVLGLEAIGATVGEQLGIFERKRRQHKEQESSPSNHKHDDYDMLEVIGDTLALDRADKRAHIKKGRSRQNKMMRGDWSHPQV